MKWGCDLTRSVLVCGTQLSFLIRIKGTLLLSRHNFVGKQIPLMEAIPMCYELTFKNPASYI